MKQHLSYLGIGLCVLGLSSLQAIQAQNVGIGIATPLEKLHVAGNIRSNTLAGVGTRLVGSDANGTLVNIAAGTNGQVLTQTAGGPVFQPITAWLTTGNAGTNGGTTVAAGTNFMGTTDNQNIDFRTNNVFRARLSNLGEFFVGTLNTVLPGDLMNGVSNATFPWAVNGYSALNGAGVYGQITGGTTNFAAVQGEYQGTSANGAGVRGLAINSSSIGVAGVENTGFGWAGVFNGDVNCLLPFAYYNLSDSRLKTNIHPIENALAKLGQIRGVEYDLNQAQYPELVPVQTHKLGVIAQEVEAVFPDLVREKNVSGITGRRGVEESEATYKLKAVNYDGLIPVLIEAVREQQAIIEVQNKKIADLQKDVETLKAN